MDKTIKVFNAGLQRETDHTIDVDGAGEIILTCTETGHFLKFPAGTTGDELKNLLAGHKAANEGKVTQEAIDAKKAEILAELTGESV